MSLKKVLGLLFVGLLVVSIIGVSGTSASAISTTLSPNTVIGIQIQFSSQGAVNVWLPAISNNSSFAGVDWTGRTSGLASGNVSLGLFSDFVDSSKGVVLHPFQFLYAPCVAWVEIVYIGISLTENFTVILAVGGNDTHRPIYEIVVPIIGQAPKNVVDVVVVSQQIIPINPIVVIAVILVAVFGVEWYHAYVVKHSHRLE